jgi:hypothetical protein
MNYLQIESLIDFQLTLNNKVMESKLEFADLYGYNKEKPVDSLQEWINEKSLDQIKIQ